MDKNDISSLPGVYGVGLLDGSINGIPHKLLKIYVYSEHANRVKELVGNFWNGYEVQYIVSDDKQTVTGMEINL